VLPTSDKTALPDKKRWVLKDFWVSLSASSLQADSRQVMNMEWQLPGM